MCSPPAPASHYFVVGTCSADVWLEGLADSGAEEVYLVINVVSDQRDAREKFGYEFPA